jgi:dihydroorotase
LPERAVLIRGGRVIDERGERTADVLVRGTVVAEVGDKLAAPRGVEVLDAGGCIVAPGFVDLHTHLREPGFEEAETVESGARAGALGGYTALVAMPNTEPPLDTAAVVQHVRDLGANAAADVHPSGCITQGRAGRDLAPLGELHALGVRLFTDDGSCVADAGVMRRAFEYATALPGAVLAQHCEDPALARGAAMHEGAWSSRLGLPGQPAEAESVIVARDLALARLTGGRIHFLHLSTAAAVDLVRAAKADGLAVTAEAAPHHFTLTDACCASYDPVFRVNPPLRTDADVDAVKRGLADGTIDAIATDHAPHPSHAKDRPFDEAPPGMLGLETALALTISELVEPGLIDLTGALALLSWQPARIAGLDRRGHGGPVDAGRPANLAVFDPTAPWEVDPQRLASRSRNTPYAGRKLTGRVRHTILFGAPTVIDGEVQR